MNGTSHHGSSEADRYRLLLSYASDAIFIMDRRGRLLEYSDQTRLLLGYTEEEMASLTVYDWDPDISSDQYSAIIESLSDEPLQVIRTHRRKDGSLYDAEVTTVKFELDGEAIIYAAVRDVTEQKQLIETVSRQHDELIAIFDQVAEGIAVLDNTGSIARINRYLADLLESDETALRGKPFAEFVAEEERSSYRGLLEIASREQQRRSLEVSLALESGQERFLNLCISTLPRTGEFLLSAADITPLKLRETLLQTQTMTDELTGLGNRRAYNRALEKQFYLFGQYSQPFSLLLADIDDFKQINDALGHAEGDRVLAEVAASLSQRLRASDACFRIGGEEFGIVLANSDVTAAAEVGRFLLKAVSGNVSADGGGVTVSIGVAGARSGDTPDVLFQRADRNLYAAKRAGKNRVVGGAHSTGAN
jgi:diguanylate cyclase (GGDEF)-like protein/PAS domain S-box-containing protein